MKTPSSVAVSAGSVSPYTLPAGSAVTVAPAQTIDQLKSWSSAVFRFSTSHLHVASTFAFAAYRPTSFAYQSPVSVYPAPATIAVCTLPLYVASVSSCCGRSKSAYPSAPSWMSDGSDASRSIPVPARTLGYVVTSSAFAPAFRGIAPSPPLPPYTPGFSSSPGNGCDDFSVFSTNRTPYAG